MPELNLLPAAIQLVEQKNPQGKVKGDSSKCFSVISPSAPVFGPEHIMSTSVHMLSTRACISYIAWLIIYHT